MVGFRAVMSLDPCLQGVLSFYLLPLSSGLQPGPLLDGRELGEGGHQGRRESNHVHRLLHHDQDQRRGQDARTEH